MDVCVFWRQWLFLNKARRCANCRRPPTANLETCSGKTTRTIKISMKTRLPQLSHSCMAEMNIFWKLAKIFGREKMAKRKFGQEKIAQMTIGQEIIVLNVRNVIYVLIANIFSTVTCGFWSFFTKVSGC